LVRVITAREPRDVPRARLHCTMMGRLPQSNCAAEQRCAYRRSAIMPQKATGLQQLMVEELQDLYDAEKQLTRALPKVAKAASDEELEQAIREHLDVTKGHVERMEQIFESLGMRAKSRPCAGMKGIVQEASETIEEKKGSESEPVVDVAIAGGARRAEHYEIAGYTAAIDMARQLGNEEVAGLLEETLQEEQEADEQLAEICKRILADAHSGEESSSEEEEEAATQRRGAGRTSRGKARAAR
jgi:ferritin-like metal-binding protein YciE